MNIEGIKILTSYTASIVLVKIVLSIFLFAFLCINIISIYNIYKNSNKLDFRYIISAVLTIGLMIILLLEKSNQTYCFIEVDENLSISYIREYFKIIRRFGHNIYQVILK